MSSFETVIGLEVHLQLKTKTKIFCACPNVFGGVANSHVCPVCLGLPGSLPVLNRQVLLDGMKVGLALGCRINTFIKFDRKNYFYPDLPKGYQISQFDLPIAEKGMVVFISGGKEKRVGITRAHIEEDAGKLVHDTVHNCSLADYNRTGTPLIEIVSEPDMRSPQEAYDYLTTLKLILSYLGVSDCDMEKGSLRCDANVSIRPAGETRLGVKTELKNLNSFSALKRAVDFEVNRHEGVILSGGKITQETLLWDEVKGRTVPMRSKENAHDYRYFPEPDLVPFTFSDVQIEDARRMLPELPAEKHSRIRRDYGVNDYDAAILIQDPALADFFEACVKIGADPKKSANWINGPVMKELNDRNCSLAGIMLTPHNLVKLMARVEDGTISNLAAKEVLAEIVVLGVDVDEVIRIKGLAQVSDDTVLIKIVDEVLMSNVKAVEEIRAGKSGVTGFLVGQAMKKMQGKANPKKINEIIARRLADG
ncbi:MAG: Asp-tRNA(Asn)/Glu-tRNA(Gln) amidotransferase subunit GatB [Candidatus Omnitrophota bacterium]